MARSLVLVTAKWCRAAGLTALVNGLLPSATPPRVIATLSVPDTVGVYVAV